MLERAENTRAAEKISWYFLRNAEKAEHAFKHGEASNSRKNENLDYKLFKLKTIEYTGDAVVIGNFIKAKHLKFYKKQYLLEELKKSREPIQF